MPLNVADSKKPKIESLPETFQLAKGWRRSVIKLVEFGLRRYYCITISPDFNRLNSEILALDEQTKRPYVIISNHQNFWDVPLIILAVSAWIDWVCKNELFDVPLFGNFLRKWAAIPFNRHKLDLTAIKTIIKRLKDKRIVGIFPQGHRCKTKEELLVYQPQSTIVNLIRKTHARVLLIGIAGEFKFHSKLELQMLPAFDLADFYDTDQNDDEIAYDLMRKVYTLAKKDYPTYDEMKQFKERHNEHTK